MSSLKMEIDQIRKEWKRRHRPAPIAKVVSRTPERRPLPEIALVNVEESVEDDDDDFDPEFSPEKPMPLEMLLSKTAEELYTQATLGCDRGHGAPLKESLLLTMRTQIAIVTEIGKKSRPELLSRTRLGESTLHRSAIWWKSRGMWPWRPARGQDLPIIPVRKRQFTSKMRGVSYEPHCGLYRATCQLDGFHTYLGRFRTEEEAARAYDAEAIRRRGDWAKTNYPRTPEAANG